ALVPDRAADCGAGDAPAAVDHDLAFAGRLDRDGHDLRRGGFCGCGCGQCRGKNKSDHHNPPSFASAERRFTFSANFCTAIISTAWLMFAWRAILPSVSPTQDPGIM